MGGEYHFRMAETTGLLDGFGILAETTSLRSWLGKADRARDMVRSDRRRRPPWVRPAPRQQTGLLPAHPDPSKANAYSHGAPIAFYTALESYFDFPPSTVVDRLPTIGLRADCGAHPRNRQPWGCALHFTAICVRSSPVLQDFFVLIMRSDPKPVKDIVLPNGQGPIRP